MKQVMVARRRLRTLPKVYKKKSGLVPTAHQQRKLNEAAIEKSMTGLTEPPLDHKRLSVVSEETDVNKLNLQSLHMAPEKPELERQTSAGDSVDDEMDDLNEQAREDKEDPNLPKLHDQTLGERKDDEHLGELQESRSEAPLDGQQDPVLTSQPVSNLEPVV